MKQNILIFVPNTLEKDKAGFLEGFSESTDECKSFFITNDEILNKFDQCIGYIGKPPYDTMSGLIFDSSAGKFTLQDADCQDYLMTEIVYDYQAFKNSDVIDTDEENYGVHIKALTEKLRDSKRQHCGDRQRIVDTCLDCSLLVIGFILRVFQAAKPLNKHSAMLSHLEDRLVMVRWFVDILKREKKFSPRIGNILVATAVDLALGLYFLNYCFRHQDIILGTFENTGKVLVGHLKHLLIYLMGSPIGLKLNHAFNNSLGVFFFYHINLWRAFLQASRPVLYTHFVYLVLPAALGASFQIAMLMDIVSLMTFHVYCIYVYATRLFSLQIKGLVSLWRLFIGRKYNPLRNRIDSCEYSPNQLFIGTLGFTILLFLLPTTTMYYVVFATFRMATLLSHGALSQLRNLFNVLPLYVVVLWLCNSPSIAGTLYIKWKECDNRNVLIEAKLSSLSLTDSVKKFATGPERCTTRPSVGTICRHFIVGTLV